MKPDRCEVNAGHRAWASALLRRAQDAGFYGTVSFTLKDGTITEAAERKTLKPPRVEKKR
jgi:hypothetical protein